MQKYFCFSRTFLEDEFRLLESNDNAINDQNVSTDQKPAESINTNSHYTTSNINNSVNTNNSSISESGRMQHKIS